MEDVRKAAVAYYERAQEHEQELAKQFFNQIDADGNGKISQQEFMEALKRLGYEQGEQNELANLFEKLDSNFDRHLDLYEALAFYHLVQHKQALFCSGCSVLLTGLYFSCLECHVKDGKSYHLCIDCRCKNKSDDHMHKSLYENTHLLHIYRKLVPCLPANGESGGSTGIVDIATLLQNYNIMQKTELFCTGCSVELCGTYFSCDVCHEKDGNTYDVCIDCHRKGKSDYHIHKSSFYENNYLLQRYRNAVYKKRVMNHPKAAKKTHQLEKALRVTRIVEGVPRLAEIAARANQDVQEEAIAAGADLGNASSDVAEHGSTLADAADHGLNFLDVASSVIDVATACAIM